MSSQLTDIISQIDSGREIRSDDAPKLILLIAHELASLVRLSGSVVAGLLGARELTLSSSDTLAAKNSENGLRDRVAFKVTECAKMLGVSRPCTI